MPPDSGPRAGPVHEAPGSRTRRCGAKAANRLHTLPGAAGPDGRPPAGRLTWFRLSLLASEVTDAGLSDLAILTNLKSLDLNAATGWRTAGSAAWPG